MTILQTVVCKVKNCGYYSQSGFCLNRLTVINPQGVCDYLTKPGWDKPVDYRFKNTYKHWEHAEAVDRIPETSENQEKDGPPQ